MRERRRLLATACLALAMVVASCGPSPSAPTPTDSCVAWQGQTICPKYWALSMGIRPDTSQLAVGTTQVFEAEWAAVGDPPLLGVQWSSSNPTVASVEGLGLDMARVTAVSSGTTLLSVVPTRSGASAQRQLTVVAQPWGSAASVSITINPSSIVATPVSGSTGDWELLFEWTIRESTGVAVALNGAEFVVLENATGQDVSRIGQVRYLQPLPVGGWSSRSNNWRGRYHPTTADHSARLIVTLSYDDANGHFGEASGSAEVR